MTTNKLCEAIKSGDNLQVFDLLERMDLEAVNERDELGCSPLHHACLFRNHLVVTKLTGTAGVDVNLADKLDYTPLHYACLQNNPRVLVNFIDAPGVDLNATNKWGLTPLHQACHYRNHEAVADLADTPGVNVNVADLKGLTALHHACRLNSLRDVATLVNTPGIDVNATDKWGLTPLHYALRNFTEITKKRGSTIWNYYCLCRNYEAETVSVLHHTCRLNCLEIVSELVSSPGINVNTQDKWGYTALHYAARSQNLTTVIKLLAVSGIDVNLRDKDGMTPVLRAAKVKDKEILELLITDQRVDMNVKNNEGEGLEEVIGLDKGSLECFLAINEARKRRLNEEEELKLDSHDDGNKLLGEGKNDARANVKNLDTQKIEDVSKKIEDTKKSLNRNEYIKERKMKNLIEKQEIEKVITKQNLIKKNSASFNQIIREVKRHSQEKIAFEKKFEESQQALTELMNKTDELALDLNKMRTCVKDDDDDGASKENLDVLREPQCGQKM